MRPVVGLSYGGDDASCVGEARSKHSYQYPLLLDLDLDESVRCAVRDALMTGHGFLDGWTECGNALSEFEQNFASWVL